MSERMYTENEVMRAAHAGAQELFGHDTLTASMLAGEVAMKLLAGSFLDEKPNPETFDWTTQPVYTQRAIQASSTKELANLIADGASRLSKSVATYCNSYAVRPEEAREGEIALSPMIFAEGSIEARDLVGTLYINVHPNDDSRHSVASLHLEGGEDAPYDHHADENKQSSFLSRSLEIVQTTVNDPIANQPKLTYYPEIRAYYKGKRFEGQDGMLFEATRGEPIEAYGSIVIADLFWALDMAITYYENVYSAGPGLTYADYRNAKCLKGDMTVDHAKARDHKELRIDSGTENRSGDRKYNTLMMDPEARTYLDDYKNSLRPNIALNNSGLLHLVR